MVICIYFGSCKQIMMNSQQSVCVLKNNCITCLSSSIINFIISSYITDIFLEFLKFTPRLWFFFRLQRILSTIHGHSRRDIKICACVQTRGFLYQIYNGRQIQTVYFATSCCVGFLFLNKHTLKYSYALFVY